MKNSNLQIVGTGHLDPRGKDRLDRFIHGYSPDVVGLEMNQNREIVGKLLRARFDSLVEGLEPKTDEQRELASDFLRYLGEIQGFELRSIQEYQTICPDVLLKYIDSDTIDPHDYVNFIVGNIKRLFPVDLEGNSLDNLKQTLRMSIEFGYMFHEIGGKFSRTDTTGMSEQDIHTLGLIHSDERNDLMAANIREIYTGKNRVLAVVGLAHLNPLEGRLRDLNPLTLALDAAGKVYV